MKILFTTLAIDTNIVGQQFYLKSAKKLASEILDKTNHDIMISTNHLSFFKDMSSNNRCIIRNNIEQNSVLSFNTEFNFNLKHHSFKDIPVYYDYIIYVDCDIKLDHWTGESDAFMDNIMSEYDYGADRLNCVLEQQIHEFQITGSALFKHKIESYEILSKYSLEDDILQARLPSEHIFILKNIPNKINKFQQKWSELNSFLQSKKGSGGAWGDGFEIGISARYAGLNKFFNLSTFYWQDTLGFQFNGNKYI